MLGPNDENRSESRRGRHLTTSVNGFPSLRRRSHRQAPPSGVALVQQPSKRLHRKSLRVPRSCRLPILNLRLWPGPVLSLEVRRTPIASARTQPGPVPSLETFDDAHQPQRPQDSYPTKPFKKRRTTSMCRFCGSIRSQAISCPHKMSWVRAALSQILVTHADSIALIAASWPTWPSNIYDHFEMPPTIRIMDDGQVYYDFKCRVETG